MKLNKRKKLTNKDNLRTNIKEKKNGATWIKRFWRILHKLKCEESHIEKELINCVKLKLFESGYHSWQVFCLPDDASCGCRALLLALMWIIIRHSFEENIDVLLLKCNNHSENMRCVDVGAEQDQVPLSRMNAMDRINYIYHIRGKIELYFRLIECFQTKKEKMKRKLLKQVKSLVKEDPNHKILKITNIDVYLHDVSMILNLYAEWVKFSDYFFAWMDTEVMSLALDQLSKEECMNIIYCSIINDLNSTKITDEENDTEETEGAVGYVDRERLATGTKCESYPQGIQYGATLDEELMTQAGDVSFLIHENHALIELIDCEIQKMRLKLKRLQPSVHVLH